MLFRRKACLLRYIVTARLLSGIAGKIHRRMIWMAGSSITDMFKETRVTSKDANMKQGNGISKWYNPK